MQIFLHFFTIRNKIPRLFTAYNHADSVYTLRSNSPPAGSVPGFWRTPSPKYASERVHTDIRGRRLWIIRATGGVDEQKCKKGICAARRERTFGGNPHLKWNERHEGEGACRSTKHQIFRQNVKICKQISFFCSKICVFKFFVVILQSVLSLWRLK